MRALFVLSWAAAAVLASARPASGDEGLNLVMVQANAASPTGGIQEALDKLPSAGGVVTIPAGEYLLRRSIRVRSNVTLLGTGENTILRKVRQAGSKLAPAVGAEDRSVRVENATGLSAGDEIGIFDQTTVGWLHAHAVIKEIRGNELLLDRRVGRSFDPAESAAVINYFPAITGTKVSKVVLKGLTIDGRSDENPGPGAVSVRGKGKPPDLGFTFAAINLLEMTEGRIEGCRIKGWPADGISVQKGRGNLVTNCLVENCKGPGYHAGGRETGSIFSDNEARGNLGDGFYFCAWVTRVAVRNNKFIGNQGSGVGGLGDSDDRDNVVESNVCEANGRSGIQLWDGAGNTVRNNICVNNSQSSPGRYSGIVLASTAASLVTGNRCFDSQLAKTQKHGIEELPNCRENTVTDNEGHTNALAGFALQGKDGRYSGNRE